MTKLTDEEPFVSYLEGLLEREDRGALAALRRGITGQPGTVPETYRYVVRWIREDADPTGPYAVSFFLVASLFALYFAGKGKGVTGEGNDIGTAFRLAKSRKADERSSDPDKPDSIDQRFTAMLNAHFDDLPNHLRHAISYLKSEGVSLDWHRLLRDIRNWNHPDRWVQKAWAKGFWGYYSKEKAEPDEVDDDI